MESFGTAILRSGNYNFPSLFKSFFFIKLIQPLSAMEENRIPGKSLSRKDFIKNTALTAAAFTIVPRHVLGGRGYTPPSDKLYIAAVGCGGEAENDIHLYASAPKKNAEIAFLCDVDDRMAGPRRKEFPKAGFYHDWREMFEKEHKN